LNAGCRLVWVIDPEKRDATTYRTLDAARHIAPDGLLEGEEVLPEFSVALSVIFEDE
jgi:Uma2 family endonuclease